MSTLTSAIKARKYGHIVPVRHMPKANTFIGTGRGEIEGSLSMSISTLEAIVFIFTWHSAERRADFAR